MGYGLNFTGMFDFFIWSVIFLFGFILNFILNLFDIYIGYYIALFMFIIYSIWYIFVKMKRK